jgi:hypothetical protein
MTYKFLHISENEKKIYARIDDDGVCRSTCTEDDIQFIEWLSEGNQPLPPAAGAK